MNRAYSLLTIKAVDDDARRIVGIATTPATDRVGDVVEPKGAEFKLPLPLLWQHNASQPIGHVTKARATAAGIEIEAEVARSDAPGTLRDRLEEAWQSVKIGLVRGLSIGFKPLEAEPIKGSYGMRFTRYAWLETSIVTIPANAEASILAVKQFDTGAPAATGQQGRPVILRPGDAGTSSKGMPQMAKTIAEQIASLEAARQAKASRMEAVLQKSMEEGRSTDAAEREEFDGLEAEVEALDGDLKRLHSVERSAAMRAKAVGEPRSLEDGGAIRGSVPATAIKAPPQLAPGIRFARLAKCIAIAKGSLGDAFHIAQARYGDDDPLLTVMKTAVVAGSTTSGNWAADLVGAETSVFADFAAYLRPATVLGKFGQNGVPGLRGVPFRVPLISQTAGGAGYWVGQGKPKPLTSFDFDRTTIEPLKVANIAVLTEESIRDSSPNSEVIVRDSLRDALVARLDTDFIDPSKAASSGVSPASITNGASAIVASGTDADAVRLDIRSVFAVFIAAYNAPTSGVWIMSPTNALALSLLINPLGQREFPGIGMTGGTLEGLPVIVSDYAGTNVVLVNASDIYLGDDGGVSIDISREASLEMLDSGLTQNALTGTGASLVSMFQLNAVALRAERTINWKRRRTSAVAYLTSAGWGGAVTAVT
jgi:HK97 family phage prohead protease